VLWTYEAGDAIESSAAIANGTVYVGVGSGEVVALDFQTGKLKWKYKAAEAIGESSPAVSNGVVYIGDLMGGVHAIDAATGKPKWTAKTGGEVKSSPVVVDGKVLIGSYDGSL
jgi:outer membrane protein assembly factor BamB